MGIYCALCLNRNSGDRLCTACPWMLYLRKTGDEEVCDKPSASEKFHNLFNKKK